MPHVSGLGTVFAPDAAQGANAASDAIDSTLNGNFMGAGDLGLGTAGTKGNALLSGAAQLGQTQVGFDPTRLDANAAGLKAISDQYWGLAQHGGMGEAAARQQALADMANIGQGGAATGRAINAGSRELTSKAAEAAVGERGANAEGSTKTGYAAAAAALQKAIYQAQVSHANHMTAIASQQMQGQLGNMQAGFSQALSNSQANARSGQASVYQDANTQTRNSALQAATAIAAGGATAYGTYSSMATNAPAQTYTADASGHVGGVNLGVPTLSGGTTGGSYSSVAAPASSKIAYHNPFDVEAEGNTAMAPDPKQWSQWLSGGGTLSP